MTLDNSDQYKTIRTSTEPVLYKDKGSKFYAYAFPLLNQEDVKPHIDRLKKEHHSARHWCYAFRLGHETEIYRVNDDGEPNNSAGQPIYGQIKSADLTNILIVVVRYFGGTKLGVGGLINAYKTAAKLSIENSDVITKTIQSKYKLYYNYELTNAVMREIKALNISIIDQNMTDSCEITIAIRKNKEVQSLAQLEKIHGLVVKQTD